MCRVLRVTLLFTLMFTLQAAWPLPTDVKETIYITADTIIYNYKTGVDIYAGNVKVDQGTSHITGDKLVTETNAAHKIKQATAYGIAQLAHYWTLPKENDPPVDAQANIIIFYPQDSRVTLKGNVVVTQGENSFHGELIHYSKNDQTIIVPASAHARAVIVYNPDKDAGKKPS